MARISKTLERKPKKVVNLVSQSAEDKEIINGKTLKQQLPFCFPVTNFTLTNITCNCAQCHEPIPDEILFAKFSQPESSQILLVDARGFCPDCGLITKYFFRVNSGGEIRWKQGDEEYVDQVGTVEPRPRLIFAGIRQQVASILNQIF